MFSFLTGISCFWKRFCQPFLDLKTSKYCTHMCAIFWIYQIGKRSSIKHSKTRNTTKNLKICMRPWIRSYQLFLDFCPRRAFLAAPGSSWQLLASAVFLFFAVGVYNIFSFCAWRLQYSFLRLQYYYFLCVFCSTCIFLILQY